MPSQINASNSGFGGIVSTGDSSGVLELQTTGTTAVTIDTSQRVGFVAGTAAAPAITRTGDTNTGMFFPAADTIAFAEGGTEAMRLDSSGNVGIGSTSPTNDSVGSVGGIVIGNGSGNKGITLFSGASTQSNIAFTRTAGSQNGLVQYDHSSDYMRFFTASTERMRIDSSGTLLVGQTTNPATGSVVIRVPNPSGNGVNAQMASNTGTAFPWSNYNASGTYIGGITSTSSATGFPTSSDKRLKKNIEDAPSAIDKILTAQVVSHDWINDEAHVEYGFIAQDLQSIIPQAVVEGTDKEDGSINMPWGVDYSKIVPLLTKAIQEQQVIINDLKARIETLENK